MRRWGYLALALSVAYVTLHAIAALLGVPPALFFASIFQAAGFMAGVVAFLLLVYQLTRR